jgi:hypothetical protein
MDYSTERVDLARIERDVRARLGETMDMCAKFDEAIVERPFGLGSPEGGRRPRDATERELTVALNTIGQYIRERAREECPKPNWEGLYDAANLIANDIGRRGLPQLMWHEGVEDDDPPFPADVSGGSG